MLNSITIRLEIWRASLEAWLSSPWTGIGWGELPYYLYQHLTTIGLDRNAHNLFIHFLAETGLIGTALLCIGIWCYLPTNFNSRTVPLIAILSIQFLHSMIEFPLFYFHFLVVASIMLGMCSGEKSE